MQSADWIFLTRAWIGCLSLSLVYWSCLANLTRRGANFLSSSNLTMENSWNLILNMCVAKIEAWVSGGCNSRRNIWVISTGVCQQQNAELATSGASTLLHDSLHTKHEWKQKYLDFQQTLPLDSIFYVTHFCLLLIVIFWVTTGWDFSKFWPTSWVPYRVLGDLWFRF